MSARTVLLALIGIVGCGPVREGPAASVPTNAPSDLFIERPRFYDANDTLYQGVVAKVLAERTGFVGSCFTMVSLVEGRPEEAVYGECPNDAHPAAIVHVMASQSIAETLRKEGIQSALLIQVKRSETTIPAEDARVLRARWLKALASAQVETGATNRESRREHFFYVLRPGLFQGFITGVSRNPRPDGIAARFTDLGERLVEVVDASESDRPKKLQALRDALSRSD
jgi:hypothetical protein